jgi:hypothetical protein
MSERTKQIAKIRERLQGRRLIWVGTRGEDARPLLALPEFSRAFSRIAPLGDPALEAEESLETISKVRVEHNTYDPNRDASPHAATLRARLDAACVVPSAIIPYKSESMLSELSFVRDARLLGMFHELQAIFDHKPWVETELSRAGVKTLPWHYVADDDPGRAGALQAALRAGPLVLRANRSRGGAGLRIVREPAELSQDALFGPDGFTAYAPYFAKGVPLNVSACVFADGSVTLHAPSLQLIGIAACTNRSLGYCGNDFAAAGQLDAGVLDAYEAMTLSAGAWLHSKGYLGSFGIDALVVGSDVYLMEINARFQGSSAEGARLSQELELPDVYTDHIAAVLGLEPAARRPLREIARKQRPLSQVIAANRRPEKVRFSGGKIEPGTRVGLLPAPDVSVMPDATLGKLVFDGAVTSDGLHLDRHAEVAALQLAGLFEPAERPQAGAEPAAASERN